MAIWVQIPDSFWILICSYVILSFIWKRFLVSNIKFGFSNRAFTKLMLELLQCDIASTFSGLVSTRQYPHSFCRPAISSPATSGTQVQCTSSNKMWTFYCIRMDSLELFNGMRLPIVYLSVDNWRAVCSVLVASVICAIRWAFCVASGPDWMIREHQCRALSTAWQERAVANAGGEWDMSDSIGLSHISNHTKSFLFKRYEYNVRENSNFYFN